MDEKSKKYLDYRNKSICGIITYIENYVLKAGDNNEKYSTR